MRSNEQAPTFHTRLSEELWPDRPSPDISFEIDEGNGSSGPSVGALSPERLSAISLEARRGGSSKLPTASTVQPTVIVVDDDPGMRKSISGLIRSVGFQVKTLASVDEFRQSGSPQGPSCFVLDVRLPGQSGLELQRELAASRTQLPIVFITGHGDIPMTVQAMKGGAIEFLTKPFRDQDLLEAV